MANFHLAKANVATIQWPEAEIVSPQSHPPAEGADEFVPRTYADRQTPSSSGLRSTDLQP